GGCGGGWGGGGGGGRGRGGRGGRGGRPHLAGGGDGPAAEDSKRPVLASPSGEGQVPARVAGRRHDLNAPAAPGDVLAVFQGAIDAVETSGQYEVSGVRIAERQGFLPVFADDVDRGP